MTIIVCVDDHYGMLFNRRRQSQDSQVRQRMLDIVDGSRLRMNGYSAKQFADQEGITVSEDFLSAADQADICFVEDIDPAAYLQICDRWVLYYCNRNYPADLYFPADALKAYTLVSSTEFAGTSHDTITETIYEKRNA